MKSHSNSHSLFCFRSTHAENCPLNFTTFSFIYLTGPIDTQFSLAHPHTQTDKRTHFLSPSEPLIFSPIASLFVSGKRRRPSDLAGCLLIEWTAGSRKSSKPSRTITSLLPSQTFCKEEGQVKKKSDPFTLFIQLIFFNISNKIDLYVVFNYWLKRLDT